MNYIFHEVRETTTSNQQTQKQWPSCCAEEMYVVKNLKILRVAMAP